jgi:hypothetical protein
VTIASGKGRLGVKSSAARSDKIFERKVSLLVVSSTEKCSA